MRPFVDGVSRPITLSVHITPEVFEGLKKLAEMHHNPIAFEAYFLLKQCINNNRQQIAEYTTMMEKFRQSLYTGVTRQPITTNESEEKEQ